LHCPDCRSEMHPSHVSGVTVTQCAHCPAIWLAAAEQEALRRTMSAQHRQASAPFRAASSPSVAFCPACETDSMQPGTVGGRDAKYCVHCRGVLVSYRRLPGDSDGVATWRQVVADVLWLLGGL
jgi:Zn-finger nucleic acid-binding protein